MDRSERRAVNGTSGGVRAAGWEDYDVARHEGEIHISPLVALGSSGGLVGKGGGTGGASFHTWGADGVGVGPAPDDVAPSMSGLGQRLR